ncbi:hypothetical protein BaRGS_00010955 [Batillaria attramentaria]|uniref:Pyruvate kinase n=1 Tax=Batillaria attramentaria TaxID=370345 RepID=A0ABD0LF55_9CAEN
MDSEGAVHRGQFDSRLAQICSLSVDSGIRPFRMTSVICTIGPACDNVDTLCELIDTGMNICRLNMAHSTLEYHKKLIHNIREAVHRTNSPSPVAIAVEIAGQGVRTGNFVSSLGDELTMKKGHEVVLTNEASLQNSCDESTLYVNSLYFLQQAQPGNKILIGDGLLSLLVKEKMDGDRILAQVETEGQVGNMCHVHIPKMVPAPENKLTDNDKECINFALEHNVDMIFAAWTWTPNVVREIKDMLGERASSMKIVACIENYAAVKNISAILEEADGIMVARGDLGMDLPLEKVFLAQKSLIGLANVAGKPVICAAQMLESMSINPRPTRAEAADVANAILDGTDCVMLSGETAKGKAPVKALKTVCAFESAVPAKNLNMPPKKKPKLLPCQTKLTFSGTFPSTDTSVGEVEKVASEARMSTSESTPKEPLKRHFQTTWLSLYPWLRKCLNVKQIAREAEMAIHHDYVYRQLRLITVVPTDTQHATAMSAVEAALRSKAAAIIVVTNSGRSATSIARYRPPCLIVAVTKSHHVVKGLHLHRSIYPVLHDAADCEEWSDDIDFRIHHALSISKQRGYIKTGSICILVTGHMPGAGWTNTVRTIVVPDLDKTPGHYTNLGNQSHLGI